MGEDDNGLDSISPLRKVTSSVTWGWYAISLSWGGIAVLLYQTPHQFTGLTTIGTIIFIANLVLYTTVTLCLLFEAVHPRKIPKPIEESPSFSARWLHIKKPQDLYFVPVSLLAFATIIFCTSSYGTPHCGRWLILTLNVFFWIYTGVSLLLAIILGWWIPYTGTNPNQHYAIVQVLPYFPPMLSGTMAGLLAPNQAPAQAIPMLVGGTTMQGLGFLMFLVILVQSMHELTTEGLPTPSVRPEMFIAVGPPSFTIIAMVSMASAAVKKLPDHYISSATSVRTADVLLIVTVAASVFLWSLAFFLFCIAALSMLEALWHRTIRFETLWWCMVFPITGFVLATIDLAEYLSSAPISWVSTGMTLFQVTLWLSITVCQLVWWVVKREF
ncbi:C4-dicarboxylate transporter/malic acid transport protein [Aspergillus sclerotioniger CBS 115572]|uniref:C4-dicarboxylate transporter/malic acid transport protein n=1 Tax=Aspergillus sclerotioniger CBS 115572 TaxID=1450535 RepID=A0A317V235_9EURO|nr:C4-dicarboxylate transporter/malic acid transport protein [Aspergillus sclerotioniger CBS 115572]PWY67088.1 C4-dicarboxylate transporter/malic acid transport protein [Aspergillus sclerotioniger CBS 115572]